MVLEQVEKISELEKQKKVRMKQRETDRRKNETQGFG